ncbi:MAG: hypothetical protein ACXQS8_00055 [Candidatus Helarchaeales archaeon]
MQLELVLTIVVFIFTIALLALFCWAALHLIAGKSREEGKRFGFCFLIAVIIVIIQMGLATFLHLPYQLALASANAASIPSNFVFDPVAGIDFIIILAAWFFLVRAFFDIGDKESFYIALLTTIFIIIYNNIVVWILGLVPINIPYIQYLFPAVPIS